MIILIFAIDKNNLFGNHGDLPWHYKEDLAYFKAKTINKKLIMGEETFKSIIKRNGKPLPNRTSIIATLTDYTYPGVEITHDIFSYLEKHQDDENWIIGGKGIISITYKLADIIYLTYIDESHEGDTYLDLDLSNFKLEMEDINGVLHFRKYIRRS